MHIEYIEYIYTFYYLICSITSIGSACEVSEQCRSNCCKLNRLKTGSTCSSPSIFSSCLHVRLPETRPIPPFKIVDSEIEDRLAFALTNLIAGSSKDDSTVGERSEALFMSKPKVYNQAYVADQLGDTALANGASSTDSSSNEASITESSDEDDEAEDEKEDEIDTEQNADNLLGDKNSFDINLNNDGENFGAKPPAARVLKLFNSLFRSILLSIIYFVIINYHVSLLYILLGKTPLAEAEELD